MNQQQGQKPSPLAGNSMKQRLFIVGIGLAGLIILLIVGYALLFGSQKSTSDILAPVAASQADIIDITEIGAKEARDAATVNATSSTSLVVTSHYAKTSARLGEDAKKIIEPYKNTEYQKVLDDAVTSGTFDKTYQALLANRLDLYRQTIVSAYADSKSKEIKKELEAFNSQVGLLLGESNTPQE